MTEPQQIPANHLRACIFPGSPREVNEWIRPCTPQREWMDQIPQKYIYRCIPLVAANTMGWELLNPVEAKVSWNGGLHNTDVTVQTDQHNPFSAGSHFGGGIVTWYLPFLFRTSPDMGLVVTGPANHEHNKAVPLDAFVRTDWLPFPFTMNWRLLEKDQDVTFKKGEPICRIYPFPLALLEETTLEITNLEDDPGFLEKMNTFGAARQANVAKQQEDAKRWMETGQEPTGEGVWNAQYVRARTKQTGEGFAPHQTVFKVKAPEDKRG